MIYEMRTYQLKVGFLTRYLEQFGRVGLPIMQRYCKLVGFWSVESGPLNRVVHIWEYESFEHRQDARAKWSRDPEWVEQYIPSVLAMVESQENVMMTAAPFSPIR